MKTKITQLFCLMKHLFYLEIVMDFTERNIRMEPIKSGKEIRKYVRIQVIGEGGVGKTSLVRRLLDKTIDGVESTDGIDIHRNCQINTSTGEWVFDKGESHIISTFI